MPNSLPRRSYDYRIREAICESRDPNLFPELDIPSSTIRSWFHRGVPDVVTSELVGDDQAQLLAENRELRRRVAILGAVVGVLVALLRLAKTRFDFERIPESDSKRALLRAIERSRKGAPLHAVIDNYSRRILSWTLEARLGSGATCRVLREAAMQIVCNAGSSLVVTDAGSENVNREVDVELNDSSLHRVLAQIDVTYSNSMIEAFWRSLKHSWLYLHGLESESELRRLIAFYVNSHNQLMPHSAFNGQTPNEIYFETGGTVESELAAGRAAAQVARMDRNRESRCGVCERGG